MAVYDRCKPAKPESRIFGDHGHFSGEKPMFRRHALFMSAALLPLAMFAAGPAQAAGASAAQIQAAITNPARPQMDMWRDDARHPAEVLAFAGIKPGDVVVDFSPGDGYYTRIISKLVGPKARRR
jgi:predicted methyltransferase